jgi:translation elongation factor EF-Ts
MNTQINPEIADLPRPGRIDHYLHSDAVTRNKGGALVKIICDTDFAARTDEFIMFGSKVAKFAYAASATCWNDIAEVYPELAVEWEQLCKKLRERIEIVSVVVMKL